MKVFSGDKIPSVSSVAAEAMRAAQPRSANTVSIFDEIISAAWNWKFSSVRNCKWQQGGERLELEHIIRWQLTQASPVLMQILQML